jgi:hypothetical protein
MIGSFVNSMNLQIELKNKEYFNKTYSITFIYLLFVDYFRTVILFLDNHNIIFKWSEMEYGMYILEINKLETSELVPKVELV